MPRNGSVVDLGRSLTNRDCVDDLAPWLAFRAGQLRTTKCLAMAQVGDQLFFQDTSSLDEQAPVDRLVGDMHAGIGRIRQPQPPRDLLWRPLQLKFSCNGTAQPRVQREQAGLRTKSPFERLRIGIRGAVSVASTMPIDFAT